MLDKSTNLQNNHDLGLATVFIYPLFVLSTLSLSLMWYYILFYFYSIHQALNGDPGAKALADMWSTQDFVLSVLATLTCGIFLYPVSSSLKDRGWTIGTFGYIVSLVCLISGALILLTLTLFLLIPCAGSNNRRR